MGQKAVDYLLQGELEPCEVSNKFEDNIPSVIRKMLARKGKRQLRYSKNESEQKSNIVMPEYLKFHESNHIICPKCKGISEIDISNFKISIKNCNYNHTMPYLFMNDFINTQLY